MGDKAPWKRVIIVVKPPSEFLGPCIEGASYADSYRFSIPVVVAPFFKTLPLARDLGIKVHRIANVENARLLWPEVNLLDNPYRDAPPADVVWPPQNPVGIITDEYIFWRKGEATLNFRKILAFQGIFSNLPEVRLVENLPEKLSCCGKKPLFAIYYGKKGIGPVQPEDPVSWSKSILWAATVKLAKEGGRSVASGKGEGRTQEGRGSGSCCGDPKLQQ